MSISGHSLGVLDGSIVILILLSVTVFSSYVVVLVLHCVPVLAWQLEAGGYDQADTSGVRAELQPPTTVLRPQIPPMNVSQDELCDRCRSLDLASYIELRVRKGRGTIAFIEKASLRRTCELCTQFNHILETFKKPRARVSNHNSFSLDFRQIQLHDTTLLYFRVRFMEFTRVLDFDFDFYPTEARIPGLSPNKSPIPLCRPMNGDSSDLVLAKQWLHFCQTSHTECARSRIWTDSLRVLDCRQHKLVLIKSSEPYACLSYVWGSSTVGTEAFGLAEGCQRMPQTVVDAMSVCTTLDIPYLWVDRYGIDQSNPSEKHHIISNMDKIYHGAHLTIVASAGQDPHHGLAGIGNTPRRRQLFLNAGPHSFASTENIREQIERSTWNSRGWTYQEMLLSRRRLVFTESQMYYQCQCSHYLEGFDMAATNGRPAWSERFLVFPHLDVSSLQGRLAEYYQRQLSVKLDVIHAFSDVCNHAVALGSSHLTHTTFSHFYGLPIYHAEARMKDEIHVDAFLTHLAWRVTHRNSITEPLELLNIIPTWSWASPKARHQSKQFSGEYWQPPALTPLRGNLKPRCFTKSGALSKLGDLFLHGTDYSNFFPQLLLEACLLEGFFSSTRSKYGTSYFDSHEDLDPNTVVAMFLGRDTINDMFEHPQWDKMICLLLYPLTFEQQLNMRGSPRLVGSNYYRRVGLWIRTQLIDGKVPTHDGDLIDDEDLNPSTEFLMKTACGQLRAADPQVSWAWRKESITLV